MLLTRPTQILNVWLFCNYHFELSDPNQPAPTRSIRCLSLMNSWQRGDIGYQYSKFARSEISDEFLNRVCEFTLCHF